MVVDESHITVPQLQGMYRGDQSRKKTLVDYGFRLPSALDNRPLSFEEFEARVQQCFTSPPLPGPYEMDKAEGRVVEQIVRPTGLMDPKITVRRHQPGGRPAGEVRAPVQRGERVLITTLTKRMAEDLTEYYQDLGLKVRYLHSDIITLERMEIIRDLRLGSSISWWASTCSGKAWTCRRSRWWPSWTRTKRAFLRFRTLADPDLRPGGPERSGRGAVLR